MTHRCRNHLIHMDAKLLRLSQITWRVNLVMVLCPNPKRRLALCSMTLALSYSNRWGSALFWHVIFYYPNYSIHYQMGFTYPNSFVIPTLYLTNSSNCYISKLLNCLLALKEMKYTITDVLLTHCVTFYIRL